MVRLTFPLRKWRILVSKRQVTAYIVYMWYGALLILFILLNFFLLCRFRVQWVLEDDKAFFFVGLGRTGFFYDLKTRTAYLRLFGILLKPTISAKPKEKHTETKLFAKLSALSHSVKSGHHIYQKIRTAEKAGKALLRFGHRILKRLTVEELRVHLIAGFDSPDLTGHMAGWYYSLIGAKPSLYNHIQITPVWDRAELQGNVRLSIAIPVYKTIIPFFQCVKELPFRDIRVLVRRTDKRSKQWKTT